MADAEKKSRRCPYCGGKVWLAKAKHMGTAETARKASELVQYLKQKR